MEEIRIIPADRPEEKPAKRQPPTFDEIHGAVKTIPRWEDPVLMAVMLPYYNLREFNLLDEREGEGRKMAGILQLLGMIEQDEARRYRISTLGKAWVAWSIAGKVLTPIHGAEFIIRHGAKFGRRILFDNVFVPSATPRAK